MSTERQALALPAGLADDAVFEPRSLPVRVVRGLIHFARRKPLGAFGGGVVAFLVLAAVLTPGHTFFGTIHLPTVTPYHYKDYSIGVDVLEGPSLNHPFGTDRLGRDLFSRLIAGIAISTAIGGSVFVIATVMSTTLTLFSAYYVRSLDLLLVRVIEVASFLPNLVLIVSLYSIFGANPTTLILTVGILGGFNNSRVLRSSIIGIRGLPYIEAAKTLGASDKRIILRHVLPNVAFIIIVSSTNGFALALLIESALAILGVGLDPSLPTLGNLLNESRNHLHIAPWLVIFPGLALFLLLLGSRLLGDALRDVLDPRLRGEGR